MKNVFFLLTALVFFACGKTEIETAVNSTPTVSINEGNVGEFLEEYPNFITDVTLYELENSLVYDENGQIIGGRFADIRNELSKEDAAKFWEALFGKPVTFVNELKEVNVNIGLTGACEIILLENYIAMPALAEGVGGDCKTVSGSFCRQFNCPD